MERVRLLQHLQSLETIKLDGLRFRLIDAKDMVVGRLAADIATILQGKDKPTYNPKQNMGDVVVVINASQVHLTHDKWQTKVYRWHTGYPGGLKSRTADKLWEKDPTEILRKAVSGMLPKNKLRIFRLDKLKIFPEAQHPFEGLEMVPYVPKPRITSAPEISWPLPDGFTPMNVERFAARALANRKYPPRRPIAGLEAFSNLLNNEEMSLLEASIRQEQDGKG
uniref:50S ribosomal protein L13 n=1 Tax=Dunaliella tertiolecta TaxID=3047 RepID=A0A7S3QXV6_DUNTE|mmetsp:Transcript_21227/g.58898  ORF Transcript_21227/g.58898 Transcript_21227/m.58898 type:complete len:223 (+) Transcript_21227:67-735(+)|eukprot:CAMPEP_0202379014 /NCGR_PEP_ID=MMETSP1127-20130417/22063_1 /ASSEMBLY_ACC=CAM_ASM_000462 /TAXON_ID=3047 /ORGANISM="Dunaliella tertiolecta, Strain CCMP1320" /LENGTH=222 /DNA_ID=CAMNT_0048977437 /DNA_START=36 /DNA_END=704 /DNA_ORIENTATION=-